MITPEQQQQIKNALQGTGLASSSPAAGNTSSWYADLKKSAAVDNQNTPAPAVDANAAHDAYVRKVNTTVGGAAKGAFDATQSGVEGMAKTLQDNTAVQDSGASVADKLGKEISTGASLAGQGTGLLFNAVGGAVNGSGLLPEWLKSAPAAAVAAVQSNPDAMAALHTIGKIAEDHPQIAQLLGGVAQTAGNLIGAEGGAAAGEKTVGAVDNAATVAKTAADDIAQTAKDKVASTAQAAKEAVVGTPEQKLAAEASKAKGELDKTIETTMPLANKEERIARAQDISFRDKTGIQREGLLGTSMRVPQEEDIARGELAHQYIKGEKDWTNQVGKINDGIVDRSKALDTFLDEKSTPANFADMRTYIEANNKPSAYLQDDPGAFKAYSRANENGLATIYREMKGTAKATGDFSEVTPGSDLRRARIAVDQQIKNQIGEKTLSEEQFRGIKAAEKNLRNVMNRMSEDTVRYPGQLEQLNKYNDFVSEMKARNGDIEIDPKELETLKAQFGLRSTPETEAAAQRIADEHKQMELLYDARDNIIDRNQNLVGKNKLQELTKKYPGTTKAAKAAASVAGIGAGVHFVP